MNCKKKAISPVIAIALLLVVTVVASVGFQNWYSSFQSGLLVDTEQRSSSIIDSVNVEFISSDGQLYITNTGINNVSVNKIKIGNIDCNINQNLSPGVNNFSITSCLNNTGTNSVFVVTEDGIVTRKLFVNEIISGSSSSSLDCSSLYGGEWIKVPASADVPTFCVMKYEAKATTSSLPYLVDQINMYCGNGNDLGANNCDTSNINITSKAQYTPLAQVNIIEARELCSKLGDGYHLITDPEWVSIARNVMQDPTNWAGEVMGSTESSGGGVFRGNVGLNDGISCDSFVKLDAITPVANCLTAGNRNKRILNVAGDSIWDFSGNLAELTNNTCDQSLWYNLNNIEWNNANLADYENINAGPVIDYNSSHGVGKYYGCISNGNRFLRSGAWNYQNKAGIFFLNLEYDVLNTYSETGFRCSYSP